MESKKCYFFKPTNLVVEPPRARVDARVEEKEPVCGIFVKKKASPELIRKLIEQSFSNDSIVDENPLSSNQAKPPKSRRV